MCSLGTRYREGCRTESPTFKKQKISKGIESSTVASVSLEHMRPLKTTLMLSSITHADNCSLRTERSKNLLDRKFPHSVGSGTTIALVKSYVCDCNAYRQIWELFNHSFYEHFLRPTLFLRF